MKWHVVLLAPVEECEAGPEFGRPLTDRVHHSSLHDLKELRPRTPPGTSIRILFVFAPEREAVLLVAGGKAGSWNRWYQEAVPLDDPGAGQPGYGG